MEIAGPVVVGAAELYFVIDCAASKGDKLKSKSRRGAMFDPNRLLCNEFACWGINEFNKNYAGAQLADLNNMHMQKTKTGIQKDQLPMLFWTFQNEAMIYICGQYLETRVMSKRMGLYGTFLFGSFPIKVKLVILLYVARS